MTQRHPRSPKGCCPPQRGILTGGSMLLNNRSCRRSVFFILLIFILPLAARPALAQSEAEQMGPVLSEEIISPSVSLYQLKQYLLKHIAKPPSPTSASQWTKDAKQLRERLLAIVFHGWPKEWVTAPPKFEDLGLIESEKSYHTHKLRYEIVPGFQSAAILYEPENLPNKVPAILNVNGHV